MKKHKTSPTQRSLDKLKKEGWYPQVVEKWIPYINIRKDLWNFIDILAIRGKEILAIQSTTNTGGQMAKHLDKIKENKFLEMVKLAGIKCELWGWAKQGERGKRKLWNVKIEKL